MGASKMGDLGLTIGSSKMGDLGLTMGSSTIGASKIGASTIGDLGLIMGASKIVSSTIGDLGLVIGDLATDLATGLLSYSSTTGLSTTGFDIIFDSSLSRGSSRTGLYWVTKELGASSIGAKTTAASSIGALSTRFVSVLSISRFAAKTIGSIIPLYLSYTFVL